MNRVTVFVLDIIAIGLFALLARIAHQSEDMPFTFGGWLSTWWPFLVGVLLSHLILLGAKRNARRAWPSGVVVWVTSAVVGLIIWGLNNQAVPHWSFILVATIMSGILLLGWRAVAARVTT